MFLQDGKVHCQYYVAVRVLPVTFGQLVEIPARCNYTMGSGITSYTRTMLARVDLSYEPTAGRLDRSHCTADDGEVGGHIPVDGGSPVTYPMPG